MAINRHISPGIHELSSPSILPYKESTLSNGLKIFYLHDPDQEVFKMDVVLPTGAYYQPQAVVASTAINLLNEGTSVHAAEAIADFFDFHGAYIDFTCGLHHSEVSLISLHKYASDTIRMLAEMITGSTFPEREMEIYLRNKKQQHLVNLEKNSYLARMEFMRVLFGQDHPYANQFVSEDFDRVTISLVRDFYFSRLSASNTRIVLSGNVDDNILKEVSSHFSGLSNKELPDVPIIPFTPATPGFYPVIRPDSVQTSIRMGKYGLRLLDEEFAPFQLLNTVLGGYFGSRLMSNIREEKGYTYGINSFNVNMPLGAYWNIATDVNGEQTKATINEIRKEINRLRQELIPDEELNLVKNYYYGEIFRELDGVFAQADALKHKLNYGIDNHFYLGMMESIRSCTSEDLLQIARKYLDPEEMFVVIAGKE